MQLTACTLRISFTTLLITLACLGLSTTAHADAGVEISAGQYKMTELDVGIDNSYGNFDAKPGNQPATWGAAAYTNFGKFKLSLGARTGKSTYQAGLSPDAQALSDSNEAALVDLTDKLNILAADEEAPAEAIAAVEDALVSVNESQDELHRQFKTRASHTGLTASAMYAVTDNVALGAEVFSNSDTDELIPSLKAESSSKHGNITLGVTLNAGDGWVGLGAVARF